MISDFSDRRIVVMGLGRFGGGVGVTRWLAAQGARVLVTDQAQPDQLAESITQLDGLSIEFRLGDHRESDLDGAELLVISPAVDKRKSAFVQAAVQRGIPLSSEMNLFLERCPGRVIGITGTSGKSTTSAMLHAILTHAAQAGELGPAAVRLGGNIGQSLLADLGTIRPQDLVVLELSSFQLEDAAVLRWRPPIAVVTHLVPNHLDRHGTFDEYADCKLNICRFQRPGDLLVLGFDSEAAGRFERIAAQTRARLLRILSESDLPLCVPGRHNRLNAALAAGVAAEIGASGRSIADALMSFSGLAHRLQFVASVQGAKFFNDSKATTPGGVAVALQSFDRPIILITGGQRKDADWSAVQVLAAQRTKRIIATGQNRSDLAALFGATPLEDLSDAILLAREHARQGDVVLFSPGSPSYDQYVNYEARGDTFIRLVRNLA